MPRVHLHMPLIPRQCSPRPPSSSLFFSLRLSLIHAPFVPPSHRQASPSVVITHHSAFNFGKQDSNSRCPVSLAAADSVETARGRRCTRKQNFCSGLGQATSLRDAMGWSSSLRSEGAYFIVNIEAGIRIVE